MIDFKPQSQHAEKNATLLDHCEWQTTSVSFERSLELSLVIILTLNSLANRVSHKSEYSLTSHIFAKSLFPKAVQGKEIDMLDR